MPNYNRVILMGHLCFDPDLKTLNGGQNKVNIRVATTRKFKGRDGNTQEKTCFVDCEAWGQQADNIVKFFKKGNAIHIEGRLEQDQWEDADTKQKRSKHYISIERWTFCGGNNNNQPQQQQQNYGYAPHQQPPQYQYQQYQQGFYPQQPMPPAGFPYGANVNPQGPPPQAPPPPPQHGNWQAPV